MGLVGYVGKSSDGHEYDGKVSDVRTVQTLIDDAIQKCGGQAELARRLGWTRQDVQHIQAGKRPVSPEIVGFLADVLELDGDEARRLAIMAMIENPKNKEKAGVLRRAFFVCWVIGAVVFCGASATLPSDAIGKSLRSNVYDNLTLYTLWCVAVALARWVRRLARHMPLAISQRVSLSVLPIVPTCSGCQAQALRVASPGLTALRAPVLFA
jgi:hypothetical protein